MIYNVIWIVPVMIYIPVPIYRYIPGIYDIPYMYTGKTYTCRVCTLCVILPAPWTAPQRVATPFHVCFF